LKINGQVAKLVQLTSPLIKSRERQRMK